MSRFRKEHPIIWWVVVILVILFVFYAVVFALGKGSVETAQGATPKHHPSAAWLKKGSLQSISTYGTQAQVASRNSRGWCASRKVTKRYHALAGTMFWVRMTKTWCYSRKGHRITAAPPPFIEHQVTTIGALLQWDDEGISDSWNSYVPYGGYTQGAHRSSVLVEFKRCFPTPIGCFKVDAYGMSVQITGQYDGGGA